ncbi:hypothetical protein VSDG_05606 [Cytospora chrysosperma]|uniref:Altered inheritance of mitochondria protein 11 n=1 Tax=Cytospora chrysosperma TaxID=252740 RepID=A0A423W090_CYTCH|nr:hypothetical protein VSDG_05606 [Valsa sordida]
MNFSTLREVYVEQALKFLGHEIPDCQHSGLLAVSNEHVLGRLETVPDLILRVRHLQTEQESFRPTNHVQEELKVFCQSAGRWLVGACTKLELLRGLLSSGSPDAAFQHHQVLIECLVHIKESLAYWEESINAKEFYGRHARSNEVRFQYLELTLRLVFIIVDLAFPEGLRAYVEELEGVLGWPELRKQFQFDNADTYARSKKWVIVGLTAPSNRIPKRFIPYGMKKLRPFWHRNPSVYGHLQVANLCCIRRRKTPPQSSLQNVPFSPNRTPEEQFRRSAKQLSLFFAGAGFLALSTMVTRRAVARKIAEASPRLFQPSNHGLRPAPRNAEEKGQDQLVAAEALGLATLNVFGFGITLTGGLMWAFDISNLEDLRTKARAKLYGPNGVVDDEAEKEIEEWIADVLSRKDKKNEGGTQPKNEG